MHKSMSIGLVTAATGLFLLAAAYVRAEYSAATGFDYSTGKYGQSASTDIFYVPLIGSYENDRWIAKLTVPYLRIKGPGTVTPDIGPVTPGIGRTTIQTQSGIGDVVLLGGFDFYHDLKSGLTLSSTAKIKFGTASRTKGLGTGENDYYFQLDAAQSFGPLTPFATLGYRFVGDPPGYSLHNVFYGSIGSAYKLDLQNSLGASLDLREKIIDGGDAAAELAVFYVHKFDPTWRIQLYTVVGFTDASPDFGLGSIVAARF
jgi:hypothetical protein